jgi:hypothetical protein
MLDKLTLSPALVMTRPFEVREAQKALNFDVALKAYLDGGDPEELRRAAGLVIGSTVPLDPDHAEAIAKLTGTTCELADYDDASRAIRRWFAMMDEASWQAKH